MTLREHWEYAIRLNREVQITAIEFSQRFEKFRDRMIERYVG
jgi:hypothetical protein